MKWSLPSLAMSRPITTTMIVVTVSCLGVIAYSLMPLEFMISVDFPVITCWMPYPGAVPMQVEKEVVIPAEGEFLTIPGVRNIRSYANSGSCYVVLRFEWGTDMSMATADVRDRIDRLKLRLPKEVERIYLRRYNQDEWAILHFAMFRAEDEDEMARLARTEVQSRLMRLDGVAEVGISGKESSDIRVEFDQNKLRSANLGIYQVISILQTSSLNLAVGELEEGDQKFFVRAQGELREVSELEDLLVGPNGLRLKDVAQVTEHADTGASSFRFDGKSGVFVWIRKEAEANTVATCEAVKAEIERIKKDPAFRGVETYIFDDQSQIIEMAMGALVQAGQFGCLLSLIVLFVFLRRIRATILVALSIPFSVLCAVMAMYFLGMTMNVVTMSSLIVSLGMLVDNSIVVIENTYRHYSLTRDPVRSALDGASEVGMAITSSTLTTIVVFIPVYYMDSGEMSLYMGEFAGPVTVALLASLFFALTVIPLAARHILGDRHRHRVLRAVLPRRFHPMESELGTQAFRPFGAAGVVYTAAISWMLRRRLAALLLVAVSAGVTFALPYRNVGMQQLPTMDLRQVTIRVEFDSNYGEDRAKETFAKLESAVNELRDELGIQNVYVDFGSYGGRIRAYLLQLSDVLSTKGNKTRYTTEEIRNIFAQRLPETVPGGKLSFGIAQAGLSETQSITLSVRGDDAEEVEKYAESFKELVKRALPGVVSCTTDRETPQQEIQLEVDSSLAAQVGVNPSVVARTVSFALGGTQLPYLKREGKEVPVRAQFQGADRSTVEDLDNVAILTPAGKLVHLNQLAKMEKGYSPGGLRREEGKSVSQVTVEVDTENLTEVRQELTNLTKAIALPRGYSVEMGVVLDELDASVRSFRGALIMAVILIYIVMASLFESFLLPLSILTTVPLAFLGVYWAMYVTGTSMDTVALIGAILMCGVIVNNGIVIVDHINQLRRHQGLDRHDAIVQGGLNRLRPVLMTALTTILGCVPIAIGTGSGQDVLNSLGRALVGGLTMGTVLTLFVVPMVYSIIDDFQVYVINFFGDVGSIVPRRAAKTDV